MYEVILRERLEAFLKRLNPWLNENNLEKVLRKITSITGSSLMEINAQIHQLITKADAFMLKLTPDEHPVPVHISFRKANKRWGSCSPTNRISFNYHLMKLPTPLIEYLIVHEFTHICCKNHSAEFWGLVGKFMPDYREKEEKIKEFEKLL